MPGRRVVLQMFEAMRIERTGRELRPSAGRVAQLLLAAHGSDARGAEPVRRERRRLSTRRR